MEELTGRTIEMTGRTTDEAIEKALHKLGVGREDVEVTVVDKGRSGILGLGAEMARVRVALRGESEDVDEVDGNRVDAVEADDLDTIDLAKETIEDLLRAMSVSASVGFSEKPATRIPSLA